MYWLYLLLTGAAALGFVLVVIRGLNRDADREMRAQVTAERRYNEAQARSVARAEAAYRANAYAALAADMETLVSREEREGRLERKET